MFPKKVEIKGWVHLLPGDSWHWTTNKDMSKYGWVLLCPYTIVFEIPADFDPTGPRIAALEKKRDDVREKFQEEVMKINEEISKLQAIGFTGQVIDPNDPLG